MRWAGGRQGTETGGEECGLGESAGLLVSGVAGVTGEASGGGANPRHSLSRGRWGEVGSSGLDILSASPGVVPTG